MKAPIDRFRTQHPCETMERVRDRKRKLRGRTSEEGLKRGKREIQGGSNREEEEGD